jgi:hypothetical protein
MDLFSVLIQIVKSLPLSLNTPLGIRNGTVDSFKISENTKSLPFIFPLYHRTQK